MKVKFKVPRPRSAKPRRRRAKRGGQNSKFKVIISLALLVIPLLYLSTSTQAAVCSSVSGDSRATGLVTAPTAEPLSKFGTSDTGACVIDIKAAFVPYKIPTYEDLKSLYFDQSKSTRKDIIEGNANQGTVTSKIDDADSDHIIYIQKDNSDHASLTINGVGFLNGRPAIPIVIFVDENLIINKDIDYSHTSSGGGLVFVVKENVYIDPEVTQIDAVIISSGIIYTASQPGTACSNSSVSFEDAAQTIMIKQLVINGSLISLNPSNPIQFCRSLGDNITPAEKINHQIKYLVILRNILSDTLQRWSEIP